MCDMADPSDFCRACRGVGRTRYETERGTTLSEPCWMCGGTGQRTVRVFPATTETLPQRLDQIFSAGMARALIAASSRPQ